MVLRFCNRCGKQRPGEPLIDYRSMVLCPACLRHLYRKDTNVTLTDEEIAEFAGMGSRGDHRKRAEAERAHHAEFTRAHVRSSHTREELEALEALEGGQEVTYHSNGIREYRNYRG